MEVLLLLVPCKKMGEEMRETEREVAMAKGYVILMRRMELKQSG